MKPGFALRVRRVEGAPLVALRLWVLAGQRVEAAPGLALLTGRSLPEGTARRDFRAIAADAEARGLSLAGFGGVESYGLVLDGLAADWQRAIDWLEELIAEPTFPDDRCDWLRRQAAAELASQADQADLLTARAFADLVYSPHPRGRPLAGSAESLAALDAAAIARHHRRGLGCGGVIAAAGEIDPDLVQARLAQLAARLGERQECAAEPPPPLPPSARRREIATRASDQAHLFVGHLTVGRAHPDYDLLELAGVVLGAGTGLAGRIPTRIREREGLAYSASADAIAGAGLDPGRLLCYLGTAPENVSRAERALAEELERFAADGVTDEELEEARSYLLGREPFQRETARQWAELLGAAEIYGLPLDRPEVATARLRAATRAEVNAAIARHLDPTRLATALGLPAAA